MMKSILSGPVFLALAIGIIETSALAAESFPVHIQVDAAQELGELKPVWRFFGADEPNYATMEHGEQLISELGKLRPREVYFRAHNLLTTGDGTPALKWGSTNAYTEDADGNPVYDWKIVDEIFDTYLEDGVRPYVEIGFTPEAMTTHDGPYRHHWGSRDRYGNIFTGWAYPPKDYEKWGELVYQWTQHCIDRYGREEVAKWYWQTWNEANIGYWQGTREEFFKLHDYAIAGVRKALPNARVGGPDSAGSGGDFTRDFFEHCLRGKNYATGETGTPIDFVSFHAKGAPKDVDGHVRMGIAEQLRTIDDGFGIVASFPELKDKPIVIGESDPEGCAACQGPQLAYRNGTMYSSYTAAVFARKYDLAKKHGVNLEGALTWAFEFEDQPYFAGFRSLATNGIDKPVLNVFRMFSKMGSQQIAAESDGQLSLDAIMKDGVRQQHDVGVLASRDDDRLTVLVWHYHDDDLPGSEAEVTLDIANWPVKNAKIKHYRVDEQHSNAFTVWKKLGSPQEPSEEDYAELTSKMGLKELKNPGNVVQEENGVQVKFNLPRAGVSLLVVE
jgi:xylan 1,4-beta-xylosidase